MASILIRVFNKLLIFETLLYVFREQISFGKEFLSFTVKHRDGTREYVKGTCEVVFNSELVKDIEVGDLILLEHTDFRSVQDSLYLPSSLESIDVLIESVKNINTCAYFLIPKDNTSVFFIIKNYPMSKYILYCNEIISLRVIGRTCTIMNNVCGKIDYPRGVFISQKIF